MRFNEKLQQLRKENKLSQEQLADMLDVTRQSVSKWESGTTYPEMDKLITMCKIFKCSLDDLTNDEVEINQNVKQNNSGLIGNIINGIIEIIDKSVKMFSSMDAKHIVGVIVSLFILGCFLCFLRIPFVYLEEGFSRIVLNIPNSGISGAFMGLFNMVLDIVFFVLYVLAFVYIYKVAYLDKFDYSTDQNEGHDSKAEHGDSVGEKVVKEIKPVHRNDERNNSLFSFFGNMIIWFFRLMVGFCLMPFVISLVGLFASLVVVIVIISEGITYFSVILGIIFAIILNVWLLEVGCVFVFNKKASFKRLLFTFFIGVAGMGVSLGMLALEVSNTTYIDEVPSEFELVSTEKEIMMSDELKLHWANYYSYLNYEVDENLTDKIVIKMEYYIDISNPVVDLNEDDTIEIHHYYSNGFFIEKRIWEVLKKDLAKKEVRNYGDLHSVRVTIVSNEENIATLKENTKKHKDEAYKLEYSCSGFEIEINNYQNRIEDLELENEELKERIKELEDYKDRVQSAID